MLSKTWNKIKRFKIFVFFLKIIAHNYGCCGICGLPWKFCKEKSVWYDTSGYFATCNYCWDNSDLKQIKTAYRKAQKNNWNLVNIYELQEVVEKLYDSEKTKRRIKKIKSIKNRLKKECNV